jgi:tRNA threonylcarbamoyl adenosine modification protein YeaZ
MLLAIDTASRVLSLALYDGQQVRAETTWTTQNQHTVELMPAIQQLMDRASTAMTDLAALAVSQGPGSFNGLRIGFSAAKGLAFARHLPLFTIPTLDIVAAAQPPPHDPLSTKLIAVVQVGRGRVCAGSYRYHWQNGQVYRWIAQNDAQIVEWKIRAGFLAELAWECWQTGASGDAASAVPFYLHQPGVAHP